MYLSICTWSSSSSLSTRITRGAFFFFFFFFLLFFLQMKMKDGDHLRSTTSLLVSWSRQVPYLDKRSGDHRWDGYIQYVPSRCHHHHDHYDHRFFYSDVYVYSDVYMYVKSRYEPAWFPRSSLSFCIFLYLLLNYMYLPTGRYLCVWWWWRACEHLPAYISPFAEVHVPPSSVAWITRYLYLYLPIPQDSGIDCNSLRPELHKSKTYKVR